MKFTGTDVGFHKFLHPDTNEQNYTEDWLNEQLKYVGHGGSGLFTNVQAFEFLKKTFASTRLSYLVEGIWLI